MASSVAACASVVPHDTSVSPTVDFRFHDIRFSVQTSRAQAAFTGERHGEKKEILKGVSGAVESGQILAIIGASGAGKTSLLDILVGKLRSGSNGGVSVTGDITVNGEKMSRSFFLQNASYVPQEDRLWSALTVRENLMFACKMYGPSMSHAQCESRVDEVIASLGLESCRDTKIGNIFLKGVSGGQKRRTSIGTELVVSRSILFLDEPTSGLDAAAASEIMSLLRRLASDRGVIVITSVHQPSTRVFNGFDQVMLLAMGQTAFFGPAIESLEHFASLGHKPDGLVNPADFLLEITNSDFSDSKAVQNLADAWVTTAACQALTRHLDSMSLAPVEPRSKLPWSSNLRQVRVLIARMTLNGIRDPAAYSLRLVLYTAFSCYLGIVYYKVENTQSNILDRLYLLLWINGFNAYMDMAVIPVFAQEQGTVIKEVQNGQYGVAHFCVANTVVQTPFVFLIAVCCCSPVYLITDMNDDPVRYLQFILMMFLMLLTAESVAQSVGVIVKNFVLGIAVYVSILSMFFLFNGYSCETMAKIVFDGQTYAGIDDCMTCFGETGEQVLASLSVGGTDLNNISILRYSGILVALTLVWRVVHYFLLWHSMF